ncbi:MAG TPA: hypothetical protein ENH85_03345 [Candidatus Scalindua sp.]|nr:hypothetical protein [Candidatus Scalindua sp.]
MKYNKFIHWLGFHNPMRCERNKMFPNLDLPSGFNGITRPKVSTFSIWTVIETQYLCLDCGRTFWMPCGNFEEWKLNEIIYRMIISPK